MVLTACTAVELNLDGSLYNNYQGEYAASYDNYVSRLKNNEKKTHANFSFK